MVNKENSSFNNDMFIWGIVGKNFCMWVLLVYIDYFITCIAILAQFQMYLLTADVGV